MWYGKGFNDGPDELNEKESNFDETSGPYYGPKSKQVEDEDEDFSLTGGWFG
jgi:hypothetical protein